MRRRLLIVALLPAAVLGPAATANDWTAGKTLSCQEKGRVFLIGVVLPSAAARSLRRTIEAVLDSLEVEARHRCRPSAVVGSAAG